MPLIATLPDTPLDIIGDIHGEYRALQQLLSHLGYTPQGTHPAGRHLILVGDLVDRGNDIPAVLSWYQQAHATSNAQMVLGNHEINLLLDDAKEGSGWYFDCRAAQDDARFAPWRHYPAAQKIALHCFLATQPLILEHTDLRIVHAAWLPDAIARLRQADNELIANHRRWEKALDDSAPAQPWYPAWQQEQRSSPDLHDPGQIPLHVIPSIPAVIPSAPSLAARKPRQPYLTTRADAGASLSAPPGGTTTMTLRLSSLVTTGAVGMLPTRLSLPRHKAGLAHGIMSSVVTMR